MLKDWDQILHSQLQRERNQRTEFKMMFKGMADEKQNYKLRAICKLTPPTPCIFMSRPMNSHRDDMGVGNDPQEQAVWELGPKPISHLVLLWRLESITVNKNRDSWPQTHWVRISQGMHWEYEINKHSTATPTGKHCPEGSGHPPGKRPVAEGCRWGTSGGTGVTQCFWMGLPGHTVQRKEGLSPWRCSEKLQTQGGTGASAEWPGIEPRNSQKTHWCLENNRAVRQAHSVGLGEVRRLSLG